jgi:peptide/nickel transport system substrate-binding protein
MRFTRIFAAIAVVLSLTAGCRRPDSDEVKVVVIGSSPRFADPSQRALSPPDEILLANIAQGLVRFDAGGQIEAGLAERWNVSDDGASYVFRIAATQWSDGSRVTAHQVARSLRRSLGATSKAQIKDTFGVVSEIVPMTDRVIEIRLRSPRPNLLQLLAQPEMAIVRDTRGTGPFRLTKKRGPNGELRLKRSLIDPDGENEREEEVWLSSADAAGAIAAFLDGRADLMLGGTAADLPLARTRSLPRTALRFDPVAGLFGLLPLRTTGPLASAEARALLSQVIDRDALVNALGVPGLFPRATILQAGLEGLGDPLPPDWLAVPVAQRRAALIAEANALFGSEETPAVRVALPNGPGADFILRLLQRDWGLLGLKVERAASPSAADFRLIDSVAPSVSPAWFLRQFRCAATPVCVTEADPLLDAARETAVAPQRAALLGEAARMMDAQTLFIPLSAPVRWSLVSSRVRGFAGNRFGRHTLTGLQEQPGTQ